MACLLDAFQAVPNRGDDLEHRRSRARHSDQAGSSVGQHLIYPQLRVSAPQETLSLLGCTNRADSAKVTSAGTFFSFLRTLPPAACCAPLPPHTERHTKS